jgi:arylsulfatase A-like enzyme
MYPHTPYQVEEPYFSAIDRTKLPKRIKPEECTGKPLMEERLRHFQHMQDYTEEEWDELRAVYLGMCMKVDEQFRRVCDALKEAGKYDNSAIFFLSDHGDFDGDYGIPEKAQNCFEDCLTKVPFLVKVSISDLNIRKGPGTDYDRVQFIPIGVYTIMEVRNGKGSSAGWGRLKSGIGWISLDFVRRI